MKPGTLYIILTSIVFCTAFLFTAHNCKRRGDEIANLKKEIHVKDEDLATARADYERSLYQLQTLRQREQAATAVLIDTLKQSERKKQTAFEMLKKAGEENEEIMDYFNTAIPDDLAIMLQTPFARGYGRICQGDAAGGVDGGMCAAGNITPAVDQP